MCPALDCLPEAASAVVVGRIRCAAVAASCLAGPDTVVLCVSLDYSLAIVEIGTFVCLFGHFALEFFIWSFVFDFRETALLTKVCFGFAFVISLIDERDFHLFRSIYQQSLRFSSELIC